MSKPVGIDALGYALPRLVLPMQAFAEGRGMEYEKLRFGLGLEAMAVPDTDEDCVTLAAQAAWQLLEQHGIAPHELGRIYLVTSSTARPCARATDSISIGIKLMSTCSSTSLSIKVLETRR